MSEVKTYKRGQPAPRDYSKPERVGIHAECRWHADDQDEGRPTLACCDCGEAWVAGGIDNLVIVADGDGWCRTHGVVDDEAVEAQP
jgi:hypothetical protein